MIVVRVFLVRLARGCDEHPDEVVCKQEKSKSDEYDNGPSTLNGLSGESDYIISEPAPRLQITAITADRTHLHVSLVAINTCRAILTMPAPAAQQANGTANGVKANGAAKHGAKSRGALKRLKAKAKAAASKNAPDSASEVQTEPESDVEVRFDIAYLGASY